MEPPPLCTDPVEYHRNCGLVETKPKLWLIFAHYVRSENNLYHGNLEFIAVCVTLISPVKVSLGKTVNSLQITDCKLLFMRVSKAANYEPNLLDATPPRSTRGSDGDHFGEALDLFLVSVSQSQKEKELKKKVHSSYLKGEPNADT